MSLYTMFGVAVQPMGGLAALEKAPPPPHAPPGNKTGRVK